VPAAPPVVTNQIVSIVLRPDHQGYIVEVSNPLSGFNLFSDTWFFTVDGNEETPESAAMIDPTHVELTMWGDVTITQVWNVVGDSGFEFANGEPLTGPMGGGFPWP
jgi:hypothetical protein